MFSKTAGLLGSFAKAKSGATAIIFGAAIIPVVLSAGLAIDCARIFHVNAKLSAAVDSAVLAAGKALRDGRSTTDVQAVAERFFTDNMEGAASSYVSIKSLTINVDRNRNSVSVDVESEVKTVIFQLAGVTKVDVPRSAVAIFDNKDIEIGLQLDVTGSMGSPMSKIEDLKLAVGDLLDIMLPDGGTSNRVRIGLAPFSSGVNAGGYAAAVSNGMAGADGCVYERRNPTRQATDVRPAGGDSLRGRPELPGAEPCPSSARVVALTDNKTLLRTTVNSYAPGGWTAGHLGAAWAWYLVSENWSTIWPSASTPAPYNDGKTQKVVILMTDGVYNTVGGRPGNEARSQTFAQDTCLAIRDKGVLVYTIGFMVQPAQATDLTNCAGSTLRFFDARNGEMLRDAFRKIAEEINNLRLSS